MTEPEPQPAVPKPRRCWFQCCLRTVLAIVTLVSSLAVFRAWGIVFCVLIGGLAVSLPRSGILWWLTSRAFAVLCGMFLLMASVFQIEAVHGFGRRTTCLGNLKQIATALLDYRKANGCFPPAYIADKNGKPMHSWRVLILPYLNSNLYKTYDFSEPWDGPHNKKLLIMRPGLYDCPSEYYDYPASASQTNYVAIVGPNAAWPGETSRKTSLVDSAGNESNTIMLVEVSNSDIAWTEPRDLSIDAWRTAEGKGHTLAPSSNHNSQSGFFITYDPCVVMADGRLRYLRPTSLSAENLRKILQVGACTEEAVDSYGTSYDDGSRLNWPNITALAVWLISVGTLLIHAVRSRRRLSVPPTVLAR